MYHRRVGILTIKLILTIYMNSYAYKYKHNTITTKCQKTK